MEQQLKDIALAELDVEEASGEGCEDNDGVDPAQSLLATGKTITCAKPPTTGLAEEGDADEEEGTLVEDNSDDVENGHVEDADVSHYVQYDDDDDDDDVGEKETYHSRNLAVRACGKYEHALVDPTDEICNSIVAACVLLKPENHDMLGNPLRSRVKARHRGGARLRLPLRIRHDGDAQGGGRG